jgi:hypothetical protein
MPDASDVPQIALPSDASPFHREYRAVVDGMQRCARSVFCFDAKVYDARAVEAARRVWRTRMTSEYRSSSVFAALVGQLMEANAPMESAAVALRLAQDEVRHADVCGQVLVALGDEPRAPAPADVCSLPRHSGTSPQERALRNVIYGCCLSEIVNSARFVDDLDRMSDPYLRDVTRQLLSDEVVHGQFGFQYLEAHRDWLAARDDVRSSLGRYLRHAFSVLEHQMSGSGARPRSLTDDERALGLPDPARLTETFYATVAGAVVPGLERFGIEAESAWRERAPDPKGTGNGTLVDG